MGFTHIFAVCDGELLACLWCRYLAIFVKQIKQGSYTVKAQYKNNPDFGKGACCSYELPELGLLGPLSRGKNKGSFRQEHNCLAREHAVVEHPYGLTFGTALQAAKGLCSYPHVLVARLGL